MFPTRVCHGELKDAESDTFDQLITSVPCVTAIDLAYYQMLLDHPFKKYEEFFSFEWMNDHCYCRVNDLTKVPAAVLYNFAIATRIPMEWSFFLFEEWSELCKAGVPPMLAFLLSTSEKTMEDSNPLKWVLDCLHAPSYHFWYDGSSDWRKIIEGTPNDDAEPSFKSAPIHCTPCNVIWNGDFKKMNSLHGKTVEQICAEFGYQITSNPEFPIYEGLSYDKDF